MKKGLLGTIVLISVSFLALSADHSSAETRKGKEEVPPVVTTKPLKSQSGQLQDPAALRAQKRSPPPVADHHSKSLQQRPTQASLDPKLADRKTPRHMNVKQKRVPKAVVRPRTDLMHHGMLEDSQRYDPRPNHRNARIQDPQTSILAHDHFQELDRNQDGKIDPVERAFSRLDMDRDLLNRQP